MSLVDLLVYSVVAAIGGLVAQSLASRRSVRGHLVSTAVALVGACLGGTFAHYRGAPGPLGGQSFPFVWAIVGATLALIGAAEIGRKWARRHGPATGSWDSSQWRRFEEEARLRWSRLTEADWRHADGNVARLATCIHERYGEARQRATRQLNQLMLRAR